MSAPSQFNRRNFLTTTTAAAAAIMSGPMARAARPEEDSNQKLEPGHFPQDFGWGVATAAYQIEGAAAEDGREPSIWDTFSQTKGKTFNGDTGDVACDHYHRFEEDVKLMERLGVKHYRFSLSWSRLIPNGRGALNPRGFDFYKRLCEALRDHDITPHVTLYHWDLPQALQDRYQGWESREVVEDFGNYAAVVVKQLGDHIHDWFTLNEIQSFARIGYAIGKPGNHAPGIALPSERERWQVTHHALLAHAQACLALRAGAKGRCSVGVAENYHIYVPLIETDEHIRAARRAFVSSTVNGGIVMPLLTGRYHEDWLEAQKENAPRCTEADRKLMRQPLDVLGSNCYLGQYVRAADNPNGYEVVGQEREFPRMNISWLRVVPEAAYWGVRLVSEAAKKTELPVWFTENGCPDGAVPDAEGNVVDADRIMFVRAYLHHAQRAVREGYPLKGYFYWSLLDNYEWAEGYNKRFGIVRTDYTTQRRIPKSSYHWYREVIRQGRLV